RHAEDDHAGPLGLDGFPQAARPLVVEVRDDVDFAAAPAGGIGPGPFRPGESRYPGHRLGVFHRVGRRQREARAQNNAGGKKKPMPSWFHHHCWILSYRPGGRRDAFPPKFSNKFFGNYLKSYWDPSMISSRLVVFFRSQLHQGFPTGALGPAMR